MLVLRSTCVVHVVWHYLSKIFYLLLCIMWLVTMSSDVTGVWQHDLVTLTLTLVLKIENRKENQKENENRKEKENKLSPLLSSLTHIVNILYDVIVLEPFIFFCVICCRLKTLELVQRLNLIPGWYKRTR